MGTLQDAVLKTETYKAANERNCGRGKKPRKVWLMLTKDAALTKSTSYRFKLMVCGGLRIYTMD